MKFSERLGFVNPRTAIQLKSLDLPTSNMLWNVFVSDFYTPLIDNQITGLTFNKFSIAFAFTYLKKTFDEMPVLANQYLTHIRIAFFNGSWFAPYDILEFAINRIPGNKPRIEAITKSINYVLTTETCGYRMIGKVFVQLTNEIEIAEIEDALEGSKNIDSVKSHLNQGLKHLSDKVKPDYSNSIKESISAVESLCKKLTGKKSTLGDLLNELDKTDPMPPGLKKGINNLYGFASNEFGIRHGKNEGDSSASFEEAKFILVISSGIINYLLTRKTG